MDLGASRSLGWRALGSFLPFCEAVVTLASAGGWRRRCAVDPSRAVLRPRTPGFLGGSPEHSPVWYECAHASLWPLSSSYLRSQPILAWIQGRASQHSDQTNGIPKHHAGQQVEIRSAPGKPAHPRLSSEHLGSGWCSHIAHDQPFPFFSCAFVIKTSRCPNLKGISCRPRNERLGFPSHGGSGGLVQNLGALIQTPGFCAPSCSYDCSSRLSTKPKATLIGTHCQGEKNRFF